MRPQTWIWIMTYALSFGSGLMLGTVVSGLLGYILALLMGAAYGLATGWAIAELEN